MAAETEPSGWRDFHCALPPTRRQASARCRTAGEQPFELVEKPELAFQNLRARAGDIEPADAIDLRKERDPPGLRRPFHREAVAAEGSRIEVAFDGPRVDQLAGRLA